MVSVTHGGLSFLTPYWTGRDMMRIHLQSIRQFHPDAPVLVSKRGGGIEEMEALDREFRVEYVLEECPHTDAVLRLFSRCRTRYACILDHDVVLLDSLQANVARIAAGEYDLVGFEERVREPAVLIERGIAPELRGWLRLAPGCTGVNFLLLDLAAFIRRFGLRGVRGHRIPGARHHEYDYGIGQRLTRHHYVRPFHTTAYGMGNLLLDGDTPIAWHQWYGAHGARLDGAPQELSVESGIEMRSAFVRAGEARFIADFPALDLAGLSPAWGPEFDVEEELTALDPPEHWLVNLGRRLRRWPTYGVRGVASRLAIRLARWRQLHGPR